MPVKIISNVMPGGGEGKSTVAKEVAFSDAFKRHFKSIAFITLDRQVDSVMWVERRKSFKKKGKVHFFSFPDKDESVLRKELNRILNEFEVVFIDTPGEGKVDYATQLAITLSQLVFIPMKTSNKARDIFEVELLKEVKRYTHNKKSNKEFYTIGTFVHANTKNESVHDYFEDILPEYVGYLKTPFRINGVFENSGAEGLTIGEYARSVKSNKKSYEQAMKAKANIELIAKDIIQLTNKL